MAFWVAELALAALALPWMETFWECVLEGMMLSDMALNCPVQDSVAAPRDGRVVFAVFGGFLSREFGWGVLSFLLI